MTAVRRPRLTAAERRAARYAKRRRRTARIVALVAILAVVSAAAVALRSPLFRVTLVEVQGATLLEPSEIIAVAGVGNGANLLLISQGAVAQRLRTLPRVASVLVRKFWPNHLVLEVEERRGMLLVPCGEVWFEVATDGMVIGLHHSAATGGMPLLTGMDAASLAVGAPLPGVTGSEVAQSLAMIIGNGELLAAADVSAQGLRADLGDGTVLHLGQTGADLGSRTRTALEILGQMRQRGQAVEYIDVRVAGQPVVKPR